MNARLRISGAGLLAGLAIALPCQAQQDTATWVRGSGQLRLRAEQWNGFGAGAPAGADLDDAFALSRLLLRGEMQWRGAVQALAELKSSAVLSRTLPGGRRPSDEDLLDVQQAWAQWTARRGAARLALRAGRFDLALGRERLVSPLDWTNTRRTFQGASARATAGTTDAFAFWARPVAVRRRKPNEPDSTRVLYGARLARGGAALAAEAYWLRSESRAAAFNGTAGAERRHTLGARLARRPAPGRVDFDVEAAHQHGTLGGARVNAWMLGTVAGWTSPGRLELRLQGGLDAASGDRAAGGENETFNQLYPLSHAYLGFADVHGRQNVIAVNAGASLRVARETSLQLDLHDFSRARGTDALYGADGGVSRPAGAGLARHVGSEMDLTIRRTWRRGRLALQAGASRYFAGAFLRQSGPARDIGWMHVQVVAGF